MKIAFNPSTVAALITPPNNKDITFDLRGRNIFARGVKFCGTDTWRDIKINNVSIGSNILDLRNGSNTTLTNINGVVTINSTWRPVVDNLTSDSTTSSLSAKQGKILKSLIDGKSNSDHNHDGRYLRLNGSDTMQGNLYLHSHGTSYIGRGLGDKSGADFTEANIVIRSWWGISFKSYDDIVRTYIDTRTGNIGTKGVLNAVGAVIQGRVYNGGDDEGIIIKPASNGYAGLILGAHNSERSVFYLTKGNPFWRYNNGSTNLDIQHPKKSGTIALLSDIPSSLKNPYSLTTFGVVYDGSSAKTVTTSTFVSQLSEGTSTVTDGTMLITSWASNSGFADTNAVNVPYKRKAIHLWEYIKTKTDSLYATKGHNHDDRYLKLTGGTMSGTIYRNSGGATISGRDHAIIRQTYAPGGSSWNPIACVDTETGTWTLGHLSSGDSDTNFHFCFSTNTDYNAGNNNGNYVTLRNKVGTIALLSEIPDKNSWNYDDRYLKLTGGTMNGNARIGHGSGNLYIGNSGNDGWVAVQDICSQNSIGDGKWSIRVDGTASFQSIKFPSNRLIAQVSSGSNSPLKGIKLPYLENNGIGIFSRVGNGTDEGGIVLSEDTCVIYNSFDTGWGLSVRDKDINQTDISGDNTIAFGIRQDHRAYSLGGFVKNGSSDSYVLLGGGGHKLESALSVSLAQQAIGTALYIGIETLQNAGYLASDYTNRYNTEEFCKALSKYLQTNYSGKSIFGTISPNSSGFFTANIYGDGFNSNGNPEHITIHYYPHGGDIINCGTSYGNWYYNSVSKAEHTHSWQSITDKIVGGNEFNIVNAGFKEGMWFNYLPINDRSKTATITGYHFGNGATGYTSIKASGFIKNGSSSSYVLLGDGGHQTISSLSVNYAASAGYANGIANKGLLDSQEKIDNFITANRFEYAIFKTTESNNVGLVSNDGMILSIPWDSTKWGAQIAFDDATSSTVKVRSKDGNWGNWYTLLHSGNYNSYSPTLTGTGASGTWDINITGNADTVDGYHVTSGNDKPWGTIPAVTTSGWMDIGKHLEFHFDNTTGSDYSTILRCTGNYSNIVNLPSAAGTLALTSDIPTTLPANGGNADTTDGVHITWAGELTSTSHLVAWEANGSALRDINPANVTVGNSDKLDGYHANSLLTALSNSDNGISITVGGTTKSVSNISVNHAASSTKSEYSRSLLGRSTSGSDYGADSSNLVFAEWNTMNDSRWYLKATGYECRVAYANNAGNADTVDGVHVNQLCRIYTFNVHNSIIKVGTLTSGQYGHVCKLRFNSGIGYNAGNQDKTMTVVIRASNGGANSNGFYFEAHSESYRSGEFTTFYLHQTSKTQCELYMSAFSYSGQSTYEVSFSAGDSWTNEISVQNALPTSNIFTLPNYQIAYTDYNVASATKLATARTIWGQSFDGTGNISGTLSGVAHIQFSADNTYNIGSNSAASKYIYTYWLGAKSGQKLELGANNSGYGQGLCIDTNLNVGIGTNTPTYKLDVKGDIRATGNSYATHFYESSDKTLKKNIKSILSSTNIPKIREFDWKDTEEHSYGFIAQELEEQGYDCLVSEVNGKKTVNYTATLALTVAKLQNLINIQNKKISNLTKELKALKYGRKKNS